VSAEESLAGFISQISGEIGAAGNQLPLPINPFILPDPIGSCVLDGSFNEPMIGPGMDQFGHIEDCILDLLRQDGLFQQQGG
jgi:hypothetical protein